MEQDTDLFTLLGIGDLPDEKKAELTQKMGSLVQRDVMMRVIDELSEADRDELEKLMEEHPDDFKKMYTFIENKVPDIDDIVKESVESLRSELLTIIAK
jgi:hypothetical protein